MKKVNSRYNHKKIEKKWQVFWDENNIFFTNLKDFSKPKKYILSMFPYPSGSGLHVGHVRNYTISDASARFYRLLGFNVLFPIGWDSFGLPSEQYAIETNNHPSVFTFKNISNFKKQLKSLGFSYDWSKEINTSDSNYYSITQWMFKRIVVNNLAEYKDFPVLWCEKLSTVLSNEEVKNINGKMFSERGNFPVIKKNTKQWIINITKYSKNLLQGLDNIDWPQSIKNLQKNWIGLTKGVKISFPVFKKNLTLEIFTTRADTVYGANSIALSYLNSILLEITSEEKKEDVINFINKWKNSNSDSDHKIFDKIDAVFTGNYCLNSFNNEMIPIWVTNFVSNEYGTGFLMISPFEIETLKKCKNKNFISDNEIKQNFRIDYSFSIKFNLPIKKIVSFDKDYFNYKYENSLLINGLTEKEKAIEKITSYIEKEEIGKVSFSSHLKDWVFSRQRYWGEPIPVVHLNEKDIFLIPDDKLPLELPFLDDFTPSPNFISPLQKLEKWVHFNENGIKGFRDTNVMPQWAGSCWYFLSFLILNKNKESKFVFDLNSKESKEIINYWMPVDLYVGGQEHANLHLLYARFWNMFLNSQNIISEKEPFKKLFCQGMIISGGEKMSKSKGNVINPDYLIEEWGADSLRLYEMFISPPSQTAIFEISKVSSMRKWLVKVYKIFVEKEIFQANFNEENENLNKIIKSIINNYHEIKFNVIISKLMEFVNILNDSEKKFSYFYAKIFIQLISPFAPHIAEEIWSVLNFDSDGKCVSESFLNLDFILNTKKEEKVKVIIKVNNKFKKNVLISQEENNEKNIFEILKNENFFENKIVLKTFFAKGKIINFICEDKKEK